LKVAITLNLRQQLPNKSIDIVAEHRKARAVHDAATRVTRAVANGTDAVERFATIDVTAEVTVTSGTMDGMDNPDRVLMAARALVAKTQMRRKSHANLKKRHAKILENKRREAVMPVKKRRKKALPVGNQELAVLVRKHLAESSAEKPHPRHVQALKSAAASRPKQDCRANSSHRANSPVR
jgi:hypothetical protein